MLYQKYSNPMDLISHYINRGRFGEFVHEFLTLENERRKQEAELEQRRELWAAYISSTFTGTFEEFRAKVLKPVSATQSGTTRHGRDEDLDEQGAAAIIDDLFG